MRTACKGGKLAAAGETGPGASGNDKLRELKQISMGQVLFRHLRL